MFWYLALLTGFGLLRLAELIVSTRHQALLLREGGAKIPEQTYLLMVAVHAGLFIGSACEVWWFKRPFLPMLGWVMLLLLALCVAGRLWVWQSLGEQWNTQIMTTARPIIVTGPYRYVRHPNYTIVIIEMCALPLVHSAYLTAFLCSALNALVLWRRLRLEESVLLIRLDYCLMMAGKPRFLPTLSRRR
jgi:methyltransferase